MTVYRGTFAVVDLVAIEQNVAAIKSLVADSTRLLVTVKANGYGHGALQAAQAAVAGGATDLGVASVEEGVFLRQSGVTVPVLVLGVVTPSGAQVAAEHGLSITLDDAWEDLPDGTFAPPLDVHVKLDTGMGRLGLRDGDRMLQVVRWLSARNDMRWQGVFTHLACADGEDTVHAEMQMRKFHDLIAQLRHEGFAPPLIHAANSAVTLRASHWHHGMVRVGIAAYGYRPADTLPVSIPLLPALNLYSFITRVELISAGDTVGYGATFVANAPTRIATIPVGYADGYFRSFSNKSHVAIRGKLAPVVGNVCMDQLMVDVTDIEGVERGDCVTLYGRYAPQEWRAQDVLSMDAKEQTAYLISSFRAQDASTPMLSLDTLARLVQTISYELMCALAARVPRIYVHPVGENFDRANSSSV
jgi:alanine racemase